MAITLVGSHVGTHAAITAQTANFSSLLNAAGGTPTLQQNDLVVVAVENASTVDRSVGGGAAVLVPSGYTGILTHNYQNDSSDSNFRVSYKVMGSSPDTSVAIPASDATTAGAAYAIYVFRGVSTASPLDVTSVVAGNINTGIADGGSITPATAGAWIAVFAGAAVAAGAVFTNPAGMSATTNHFRSATITTTTNDANIGGALKTDWAAGAFDPAVFGGSTSTNTGSWSAVTIALRPAQDHAATGTPAGPGASVAGTAAHIAIHGATGALAGPGSAIAGTSAHIAIHLTSGTLTGQLGSIAGSAARTRQHANTGAISGPGSTLAGVAAHSALHSASGVLAGQIGSLSASASRFRALGSSGDLSGGGSALEGSAEIPATAVEHGVSGSLIGQNTIIAGIALLVSRRTVAVRTRRRRGNRFRDYPDEWGVWR